MGDNICIGQGRAVGKTIKGPCSGPSSEAISLDEAAALLEKALEDAQDDANKQCPEGCECKGEAIVGEPYCVPIKGDDGGEAHFFIVTAAFYGECVCPGGKKPAAAPGAPAISGKGYREFFRKVKDLPELPRDGSGGCHMYQRQVGRGFPVPVCFGDCVAGKCKGARVIFKGVDFTIEPCGCR